MSYLLALWAFVKGIDPSWLLIAGFGVACFFCGCKCEHDRPHWIVTQEPETTVLSINGQDVVYDRLPGGGWKRRD